MEAGCSLLKWVIVVGIQHNILALSLHTSISWNKSAGMKCWETLQTEIPERKPSPDTQQSVRQADLRNLAWWCVVKCRASTHSLHFVYRTSGLQNVSWCPAWMISRVKKHSVLWTHCQTVTQEQVSTKCYSANEDHTRLSITHTLHHS